MADGQPGDSVIQLLLFVEGDSEETFIKNTLNPYLFDKDIIITPTKITTCIKERKYQGGVGNTTFDILKRDIMRFSHNQGYCGCFFDLYGLPKAFPGYAASRDEKDPYKRIEIIERSLFERIAIPTFIPYIQLHEFEALLFSDIEKIDENLSYYSGVSQKKRLKEILSQFHNPELINDSPVTAPSRRLKTLYPNYQKMLHGIHILVDIPLSKMREQCRHFNEWLNKVENLQSHS